MLFQGKGCAMCHDGPDSVAPVAVGPPLDDVASFAGSRIDGTSAADYVRLSIVAPQSFISPAAPVRDVLERAGSPAWFDPFGGGA